MSQGRILIVDDKENIRAVLSAILEDEGYDVHTAGNAGEGLEKITALLPDVVVSDIKMPGMDGISFQKKIRDIDADIPVILITAYGSIESAVAAIKQGAYDYLTKPVDHDRLKILVQRAVDKRRYVIENIRFRRELQDKYSFRHMVGSSAKMRKVFEMIWTVAGTLSTVLIQGESGTGKELVARAIHYNSPRQDKPLIEINCSALSEGLLESELFGHEKGAFTGATARKTGRFEMAHQGTLFLDEVGEISPSLQVKLLRVLQEKQFERVGGTEPVRSDFRLVAATNKDLRNEIVKGSFREDLYYRLGVITIKIPPLRERPEDISPLINHFLRKYCDRENKDLKSVSAEAMNILVKYRWPGNVRELENCIERAVVISHADRVGIGDLPEEISERVLKEIPGESRPVFGFMPGERVHDLDLHEKEKELILEALRQTGWNKARAAKLLNIHRRTIYNRIKKYSLGLIRGE
ncbi:MAG: sigma-54 dependent transcriptional regulator [Thermodesulfobacteriota bacterium]